jgi:hypothetical protein
MIAFLIIVLFTLALFHWAYESAMAPSFRLGARYKLFALRDELRHFSAQKQIQLDEAAIQVLEGSINSSIEYMSGFDFALARAFRKRCSVDPSFRKRMARRSSLIESYRDPEFQALRQRYEYIFGKITMINSGGWFIYIVPVAVGVVFWKTLCKMVTRLSVVSGDDFPELSRGLGDACGEPA